MQKGMVRVLEVQEYTYPQGRRLHGSWQAAQLELSMFDLQSNWTVPVFGSFKDKSMTLMKRTLATFFLKPPLHPAAACFPPSTPSWWCVEVCHPQSSKLLLDGNGVWGISTA